MDDDNDSTIVPRDTDAQSTVSTSSDDDSSIDTAVLFDMQVADEWNTQHKAKLSGDWLSKLSDRLHKQRPPPTHPVKICILDTGYDAENDLIKGVQTRIKGIRSWLGPTTTDGLLASSASSSLGKGDIDTCGHGTHITWLVSQVAPCADLYLGRVIEKNLPDPHTVNRVADAIKYAVEEWQVDVITMSFGFPGSAVIPQIQQRIREATDKHVLVFAAASNDGNNQDPPIAYPAREEGVFAIGSTDSFGMPSPFSPPPQHNDSNFATLGEGVNSAWPKRLGGPMRIMSGTSVACPIGAALAALILDYAREQPKIKDPSLFSQYGCMRLALSKMAGKSKLDYKYLAPWKLLWDQSTRAGRKGVIENLETIMHSFTRPTFDIFLPQVEAPEYNEVTNERKSLAMTKILESLCFTTMMERYEEITEAHRKTFRWIFRDPTKHQKPWDSFAKWVRTGDGLYWLNGKAASGKSTLMRYIYDSEETRNLLRGWAGSDRLIYASYFFWNSGTVEQRSHKGLLRSLIYQALSEAPHFIPEVFPNQWKRAMSAAVASDTMPGSRESFSFWTSSIRRENWSLPKLTEALGLLMHLNIKFCFLIDGLDEYEGDSAEIASLFQELANLPNVKACVSSRPLIVFEDAFEKLPSLRLQDLTHEDITRYVYSSFEDNARWKAVATREPRKSLALLDEIIGKADGVFLWVKLVITSLIKGLNNRDEIFDLQKSLDVLPEDLEKLYMHMLKRIEPEFYLEQASRIFQLVRMAREARDSVVQRSHLDTFPITVLELAIADSEEATQLQYLEDDQLLGISDMLSKSVHMASRLKSRCAGLLELGDATTGKWSIVSGEIVGEGRLKSTSQPVVYLHRTVRDFLEREEVWELMLAYTNRTDFHPESSLLRSSAIMLKSFQRDADTFEAGMTLSQYSLPDSMWYFVLPAMHYAYLADINTLQSNEDILEELDRVASKRYSSHSNSKHWSTELQSRAASQYPGTMDSFISYTAQCGLFLYLKRKISNNKGLRRLKPGRPLLDYAVYPYIPRPPNQNCAKIVSLLLQSGASPNELFLGRSPWQRTIFYSLEDPDQPHLLEVLNLLVEHGADVNAFCDMGRDHSQLSALSAVRYTARSSDSDALADSLIDLMLDHGARDGEDGAGAKCSDVDPSSSQVLYDGVLSPVYRSIPDWQSSTLPMSTPHSGSKKHSSTTKNLSTPKIAYERPLSTPLEYPKLSSTREKLRQLSPRSFSSQTLPAPPRDSSSRSLPRRKNPKESLPRRARAQPLPLYPSTSSTSQVSSRGSPLPSRPLSANGLLPRTTSAPESRRRQLGELEELFKVLS